MHQVSETIQQFIKTQQALPKRIVVAFSGGVDSTVLLHSLARMALPCPLLAVHVHHGLANEAEAWAEHCETLAKAWAVDFKLVRIQVRNDGRGIEAAARHQRYQSLQAMMQPGDWLATGHHQRDQAETFLLRLLRGSGWRGLGAIRAARTFGPGTLVRPLLSLAKASLLDYAHNEQIAWVEDHSNQSDRFDRNYLRHQLLPILQNRWPHGERSIARAAELLAEGDELMHQYGERDLADLSPRGERMGESILWRPLERWTPARRAHVLRVWLMSVGAEMPARHQFDQLQALLHARADRMPSLVWGGWELRRFRARLYLIPATLLQSHWPAETVLNWNIVRESCCTLPDAGRLEAHPAASGLRGDCHYRVVCRSLAPMRAHPHDRAHSQTLKKLFQERGLETWLRDRVPILFHGERLAAVGDLWVEKDYWREAGEKQSAWALRWHYPERVASLRSDDFDAVECD